TDDGSGDTTDDDTNTDDGSDDNTDDDNKDDSSTDADKIEPSLPSDKVEVEDDENLTDEEKEEVKDNIEEANKDKLPEGTDVDVDDNGDATITYPDGSKDTIDGDDLVSQKEDDGKEESKTDAEKNPANLPENKVEVDNKDKLSQEEINKVIDAVKRANPEAVEVIVDSKGNATLVYKDGSKNFIEANKLVVEKKAPIKVPSQNAANRPAANSTNKNANKNVKTGVTGLTGVLATLAAAAGGLFISKKKEEDK
ncbi:MAG: hypothetical protein Q4D88_04825, partial [Anaerococcus sp.]|nr:hypothetical protein [Anaerococcus sp.]